MRLSLHGVHGHEALFTNGEQGVVVNTRSLTASVKSFDSVSIDRFWIAPSPGAPLSTWKEIAQHALSSNQSDVTVVASGVDNRAFTVPKAVASAARTALQTSRTDQPGVTAVGRRVAGILASGNQVTKDDVLYVARFFKRNTEASAGAQRWQLWGGNHGRNWAAQASSKIPVTADGDTEVHLIEFYEGDETQRTFQVERDGEHALSLFKQISENEWAAWGNGDWFACDAPARERLVEVDDDTAVFVAGALYDAPDTPVNLRDLDPEEWDIVQDGIAGIDWDAVETAMTPAALSAAAPTRPGQRDGNYTPEERSANAGSQLRDGNGRFITMGDSGTMESGTRGKITGINPADGNVIVQADDGHSYSVPAPTFKVDGGREVPEPQPGGDGDPSKVTPLDLKGILGQPRATKTTPKAWMKKLLPPMGAGQLKKVIDDYGQFIKDERQKNAKKFKPNNAPHFAVDGDVETPPPAPEEKTNPDNSDVAPMYLAIVDRDDPQAVTDLVALVPASPSSDEPTAYRRVAGEWVEDVKVLQDMRSPTPPPVVKLDQVTYQDVLTQVDASLPEEGGAAPAEEPAAPAAPAPVQADGELKLGISMDPACIFGWDEDGNLCAIVAAGEGGLDRNRGNAEKLRRYWLYGKGAAKIRWGTDGDWTRCVRQLSKYLGPRAKGYCALRHHEATGMWTGDRRHRQEHSLTAGGTLQWSTEEIRRKPDVLRASADRARMLSAKQRVYGMADEIGPVPQDAGQVTEGRAGRAFRIPLVIPEGLESGDGRTFERGALSMRSFPIPLMWQIKTSDGHDGSFVVGRIDRVERTEDGLGNAYGVFDTGPYGAEAQRMVENRMLRFVSADLDRFEAEEVALAEDDDAPRKLKIKKGRLMGVTLVAKPAFQECTIELVPLEEVVPVNDGTYVGETPPGEDGVAIVASSGISRAIPVEPPKTWFERPVLNGPTPINVTDQGQVFGHIATWEMNHIGLPGATRAPRSASNYAYFHTGVLRTQEGADVTVGQLTLAGGHADLTADAAAAVRHYDDTGSAIADVHAGEDSYGIWVAGALRPGTSPEQVRALRASAPSGDWRVINNRLELVAVCQVNVPGFPVTRAQIVASGGVYALVAAGTETLAKMRQSPMDELSQRIAAIEQHELARQAERREQILSRMKPVLDERKTKAEELENMAASARARVYKVMDVDGYLTQFKEYSQEKREQLIADRLALKDGSFAIENVTDLRRAILAYNNLEDSDRQAAVRRHVVRRARALDKFNLVPSDWRECSMNDLALYREDSRQVIAAAALANKRETLSKRVRGEG